MQFMIEDFEPDIDRVRMAVAHRMPDRVPNVEMFVSPVVREALLGRPPQTGLAGELEYRTQWGYDFLYIVPSYKTPPVYSHDKNNGNSVDGREWRELHGSMITDWNSFRSYSYPAPGSLCLEELREAVRLAETLPGNVGVGCLMPSAPFMEVCLLMGYERFAVTLHEDFELCRAVVDVIGRTGVGNMEQLCQEKGVDFILYGDDMAYTGGMMISPAMMRELFFPWYRQFIATARDAGKMIFFHSDGDIRPVIPDFIDAGLQGLNPIEPLAMDIVELKQQYGDKIALIGNIDVDLLARGTPGQVEAQVHERIAQLAPGGGYMLASSNSICDYVRPENYVAMLEAGETVTSSLRFQF